MNTALLAVLAIGQASTAPAPPSILLGQGNTTAIVPNQRMAAIWEAFNNRLDAQNDIWFDDGEFPRCVQAIRIQHSLDPADWDIMTNLGWMLENVERWDEALAVYVANRKRYPNDPDAPFPEARFYYMKKAYSKVPPLLEPTIKMAKKPHPNNHRTLAQAYERMGLLADAKRVYLELLKLMPDDGATKMNLARVERKLKGEDKKDPPRNR